MNYAYQKTLFRLASVAGVDLNDDSAKVVLYTVPTGKSCIITHVVVRNASINLTTAEYGFGFDANAVDVIAAAAHVELDGATKYTVLTAKAGSVRGVAAGTFGIKVTVEQGAAATATIEVFGYLF